MSTKDMRMNVITIIDAREGEESTLGWALGPLDFKKNASIKIYDPSDDCEECTERSNFLGQTHLNFDFRFSFNIIHIPNIELQKMCNIDFGKLVIFHISLDLA